MAAGRRSAQKLEIVSRHLAALAVGDELKAHLLTFLQVADASALHSADVDKGVAAAVVRRNEAKALLGIKPFHGSRSHKETLSQTELSCARCRGQSKTGFSGEKIVSAALI